MFERDDGRVRFFCGNDDWQEQPKKKAICNKHILCFVRQIEKRTRPTQLGSPCGRSSHYTLLAAWMSSSCQKEEDQRSSDLPAVDPRNTEKRTTKIERYLAVPVSAHLVPLRLCLAVSLFQTQIIKLHPNPKNQTLLQQITNQMKTASKANTLQPPNKKNRPPPDLRHQTYRAPKN
mmetsp:Transcript_8147/g.14753  ORF Transcript_8147/g.14753 Transcript_8147/m.14753 type:complete len:176 (+) Transcript_8147:176-703(+)